jgi:FMN phosphatase YigB (HAD superfamily)
LLCFDLDGTLLDNKQAVIEAYRVAGVEMPPDAWGRPWKEWLFNSNQHDLKNAAYPSMLEKYGRPLPALDIMRMWWPNTHILTGASPGAANAALDFLHVGRHVGIDWGMTTRDKLAWLRQEYRPYEPCLYYDDDEAFLEEVKKETSWHTVSARWLSSLPPGSVRGLAWG